MSSVDVAAGEFPILPQRAPHCVHIKQSWLNSETKPETKEHESRMQFPGTRDKKDEAGQEETLRVYEKEGRKFQAS